jgi:hypothetical protein
MTSLSLTMKKKNERKKTDFDASAVVTAFNHLIVMTIRFLHSHFFSRIA